jgi:hypothetical protein
MFQNASFGRRVEDLLMQLLRATAAEERLRQRVNLFGGQRDSSSDP